MTRIRELLLLICFAASSSYLLTAQSQESAQADIDMVRATYAKLIFAARIGDIREGVLSGDVDRKERLRLHLVVTLSDMKTGPVNDLRKMQYTDVITKPSGNVLAVTPGSWTLKTKDGRLLLGETASLSWTNHGLNVELWQSFEDRHILFGQALDETVGKEYTRYAWFTAKVSYAGQERQYKALFLFGQDAAENPVTLTMDSIVGGGASELHSFIDAPVTPDPLLEEQFRNLPETKKLIKSMRASPSCTPEPRTKMCCDEASGHCGVDADTLQRHGFVFSAATASATPDN